MTRTFKVRPKWVANRVEALRAYLNNEPDARDWLQSTGMNRPYQTQTGDGTWQPCECPHCQDRDINHQGNISPFRKPKGR